MGGFLVFQSTAHLTSDQEGFGSEAGQVFEYDAGAESLVRVSHGQNGFNDDGNSNEYSATIPCRVMMTVKTACGYWTFFAFGGVGGWFSCVLLD